MKNNQTTKPCEICCGKMHPPKHWVLRVCHTATNELLDVCSWCAKGVIMSDAIENPEQA